MAIDLVDLQKRFQILHSEVLCNAVQRVKTCIANPGQGRYVDDPTTLLIAEWLWIATGFDHHSKWNDRFCITMACNMSFEQKRIATWCAISNGLNGYWQWTTSSGYSVTDILKYLGVTFDSVEPTVGYSFLDREIAIQLVRLFSLPTCTFWPLFGLNPEQEVQRDNYNQQYPYILIL